MNLEATIDAVAPYLREACRDLPVSTSKGAIFPLHELADRTGTNLRLLGKIRKRFKAALAQSLTPGRDPEFVVDEQSFYGRAAITVHRAKAPQ